MVRSIFSPEALSVGNDLIIFIFVPYLNNVLQIGYDAVCLFDDIKRIAITFGVLGVTNQ